MLIPQARRYSVIVRSKAERNPLRSGVDHTMDAKRPPDLMTRCMPFNAREISGMYISALREITASNESDAKSSSSAFMTLHSSVAKPTALASAAAITSKSAAISVAMTRPLPPTLLAASRDCPPAPAPISRIVSPTESLAMLNICSVAAPRTESTSGFHWARAARN